MDNKTLIDQLAKSYGMARYYIKEHECGVVRRSKETIEACHNIVNRIDSVISTLKDDDKFIIYNEVVLGKKGDWYRDYVSVSTYYRYSKVAYSDFINEIK